MKITLHVFRTVKNTHTDKWGGGGGGRGGLGFRRCSLLRTIATYTQAELIESLRSRRKPYLNIGLIVMRLFKVNARSATTVNTYRSTAVQHSSPPLMSADAPR